MLNSIPPYPIWSIWPDLSLFERSFSLALGGLSIYFLFSATVTMARLRNTRTALHKVDGPSIERTLAVIRRRSTRLQELTRAAFCLFGVVLFSGLQWSYVTIGLSSTPVGWLVLKSFEVQFAFGFNVFCVFLILHVLRWFVAARVEAYALQLTL